MKKYIYTLLFSSSFIACTDFLVENPQSNYVGTDFCQTPDEVKTALNGAYKSVGSLSVSGYNASKLPTDLEKRATWSSESGLGNYSFTAQHVYPYELWKANYKGIRDCNYVLESLKEMGTEDQYVSTIGQLRGLRGYFYFNLLRNFGGVPLVTSIATSPNDPILKPHRATLEKTAQFIIDDLNYAAENSILDSEGGFKYGMFGQYAAHGFLAKIYLYLASISERDKIDYLGGARANYLLAMEHAQKIMKSGRYKLCDFYPDIFNARTKNKAMEEVIFAVCHNSDSFTGGSVGLMYGLTGVKEYGASNTMKAVTNYAATIYEPSDSIRRLWNVPRGTINLVTDSVTGISSAICRGYDYNDAKYLPTKLVAGVTVSKTPLDGWKDAGFMFSFGKFRRFPLENVTTYVQNEFGMDEPVLRFADILLIFAESYNEYYKQPGAYTPSTSLSMDGTNVASAFDAVNLVRKRARVGVKAYIHEDVFPRVYDYERMDLTGHTALVGTVNLYTTGIISNSAGEPSTATPDFPLFTPEQGVVADWRPGFFGFSYPDSEAADILNGTTEVLAGETYILNGYDSDYTAFKYEILNERAREFINEANDRWFDLSRRNMLVSACEKCYSFKNPLIGTYNNSEGSRWGYFSPLNIRPYMITLPIPSREIDVNSNLKQNPGY